MLSIPLDERMRADAGSSGTWAFLASANLGALRTWLARTPIRPKRVAFVDTAAKPMREAPFVASCRNALEQWGYHVQDLDLLTANAEVVTDRLRSVEAVFVTGGYPLYLLQYARLSGFADVASLLIRNGELAYIGVSAGAALLGPDMAPLAAPDDPGVTPTTGAMGVVDFVVLPHSNRWPEGSREALGNSYAGKLRCIIISDDQAVIVEDGKERILASSTPF